MKLSKGWIIAIIAVLFIILIFSWVKGSYNNFVSLDATVTQQWSDVKADYQRRLDLYSTVLQTVKAAANFEQKTQIGVVEARAKATSTIANPKTIDGNALKNYDQTQTELTKSIGSIISVVVEKYPELKATQAFMDFQTQQEGTENRINVSRRNFNTAVKDYNIAVKSFPGNIFAGLFGFKEKASYEAETGAEKAPKLEF
jgi:LemA protein